MNGVSRPVVQDRDLTTFVRQVGLSPSVIVVNVHTEISLSKNCWSCLKDKFGVNQNLALLFEVTDSAGR